MEDVLAPNCCALCGRRVWGRTGGVPNYLCAPCLREHREAVEGQAAWYTWLYRQEHSRRKRRTTLLKRGAPSLVSLDELIAVNSI